MKWRQNANILQIGVGARVIIAAIAAAALWAGFFWATSTGGGL
ncbi:MAG: hypothetical protein AAF401_02835 [Pseudomonadota bacterium]